jgi:Ca2+-dependent lipid-binding protein
MYRNNGTKPAGFVALGNVASPGPPPRKVKITIVGATNVPAMDRGGTSDPYLVVKTSNKTKLLTTKVHKKTLNPIWNESLVVDVNTITSLKFKVYDKDLLSDDKIGSLSFTIPDIGPDAATIALPITKKGKNCGMLNITLEKQLN